MTGSTKSRKKRSYLAGEKGKNRVRLFPHQRDGKLMLEYRDEFRAKRRISLGHIDLERGKAAADELAADLRKAIPLTEEELTLRTLFDKYETVMTPKKGAGKQKHDRMARRLFERCWGAETPVESLDETHWNDFIEQRRSGQLAPPGPRGAAKAPKERKGHGVGDRQVQYDLSFLRAVLNWALTVGSNGKGKRLLDLDPFHGLKKPDEGAPTQPVLTDNEYQALLAAAVRIDRADILLFLILAHETGHRGAQLRRLRWNDFNPASGAIRWRAPARRLRDRKNFDHTTVAPDAAVTALREAQGFSKRIGDQLIFQAFEGLDDERAHYLTLRWWKMLERSAGLPHVKGRGWHSLRRNFATEYKHADVPLVDVAHYGGWNGLTTLQERYMKADEQTMRSMPEKRVPLRAPAVATG